MSENPEVLLTRINLGAQNYRRGGAGYVIDRNDVLAAIGMGHLSEPCWLAIQVLYLRDESALRPLAKKLWVAAADLAAEYQWDIPRGEELLRKLAVLAIYELMQPNLCPACKNDAKDKLTCRMCRGDGYRNLPERFQASVCGVSKTWWRNCWRRRYDEVRTVLRGWLLEADEYFAFDAGQIGGAAARGGSDSAPQKPWSFDSRTDQELRQEQRRVAREKSTGH